MIIADKPTINTPTNAHVVLKNLIVEITENSYQLPYLTKKQTSNDSLEESPNHLQDFKSYEELLAAAIINQVNFGCLHYILNSLSSNEWQILTKNFSILLNR